MSDDEVKKLLDRESKLAALLLDRAAGRGEKEAALNAFAGVQERLAALGVPRSVSRVGAAASCSTCEGHARTIRSLRMELSEVHRVASGLRRDVDTLRTTNRLNADMVDELNEKLREADRAANDTPKNDWGEREWRERQRKTYVRLGGLTFVPSKYRQKCEVCRNWYEAGAYIGPVRDKKWGHAKCAYPEYDGPERYEEAA